MLHKTPYKYNNSGLMVPLANHDKPSYLALRPEGNSMLWPYSQGAEDLPLRADLADRQKKLERNKSVKFIFLFSVTDNVFLQILKLKISCNPSPRVCDIHDICLLGDALFTVQLLLVARASGRFETDDPMSKAKHQSVALTALAVCIQNKHTKVSFSHWNQWTVSSQ